MTRLKSWTFFAIGTTILEVSLVVLLGISMAHWTWLGLSARPMAAPEAGEGSDGADVGSSRVKRGLFGVAQRGNTSPAAEAPTESSVKLLGVIASGVSHSGSAVFLLESGRRKAVEAGWQIEPGLVLKEVHSDYVVVARNGAAERIKLNRRIPPEH